jgi:hypothetical protein
MIGPTVDRSTGAGAVVGDALLGDATALATGGLLGGGTLDGNELGRALADADADTDNAAGDEATGGLLGLDAE